MRHPRIRLKVGDKFGLWTITASAPPDKYLRTRWFCECKCGTVKSIADNNLKKGSTQSCGCVNGEPHRMSKSSEYQAWAGMIQRCTNIKNARYYRYGARGITVCEQWVKSFMAFYKDMGPRPSPKHSIERIDNDKGYSKENCVWSTSPIQNRNKGNNVHLTLNGITRCVTDWSIALDIKRRTIEGRLKRGWTVERALTAPVQPWRC